MLSYTEIFNIQKTTLPLSKQQLDSILSNSVFNGYVQCSYNTLIQTLKEIAVAETYNCTINDETLYANNSNPLKKSDCIISIEGTRYYEEFINRIISNEDSKEWTDFTTYSATFRDELKNLKSKIIQNILWNPRNLNNWFEENSVALLQDAKDELMTNYEKFKEKILLTSDLYSFIESCDETELKKATNILSSNLVKKLEKYKHELLAHIKNNTKRSEMITIKHPIVKRIFIVSAYAKQCEKEWPKIKFTALDKRSFDTLSMWED